VEAPDIRDLPAIKEKALLLTDISCLWISSLGALRWPENPMAGATTPKAVRFLTAEKQFGRVSFFFFHTNFSLPRLFLPARILSRGLSDRNICCEIDQHAV
jgi:hypothetical protein